MRVVLRVLLSAARACVEERGHRTMVTRVGVVLNASRRIALIAATMTAGTTPIVAAAIAFEQARQGQPASAAPQTPRPRFDVVSVKLSAPAPDDGPVLGMPGAFLPEGQFRATNAEFEIILRRAYPEFAKPGLLIAPDWIAELKVDIDARAGKDVPI